MPVEDVRLLFEYLRSALGVVKIGGCRSASFALAAGVRQGSMLGGTLWAVYLDDLLTRLELSGAGCRLDGFRDAASYADDIFLVSTTRFGLNRLVDISTRYALRHHITSQLVLK